MSLIRLVSDIHIDHKRFDLPKLKKDFETTLIIAGDISNYRERYESRQRWGQSTLELVYEVKNRFRDVILVPGNHDFYGGVFEQANEDYHNIFRTFSNVHYLNNGTIVDDEGTWYVGATLWTDVDNNSEELKISAQTTFSDYKWILQDKGDGIQRLSPETTYQEFLKSLKFIREEIEMIREKDPNAKIVVVSHHAPSARSIHKDYLDHPHNGLYCSKLDGFIEKMSPNMWCHGHVHQKFNYHIGSTNVLCNPRGYPFERDLNFDPKFRIKL